MGENAAFYPKKYLAIPTSFVQMYPLAGHSVNKEGSSQSFKYWQYHFMNKIMEYY
jgi:hypothetical protein